ncbi:MAG: hypothetical protein IJ300_00185, partial [Clostridia bacterium]|nr:hypothetical protein [Clostridia bacterium]
RWILPKAKYGGRENADIMQFFNYPSVTYGDSSPDKGSHDLYFIDKLTGIERILNACFLYAFMFYFTASFFLVNTTTPPARSITEAAT